jgi:hypothetical protein
MTPAREVVLAVILQKFVILVDGEDEGLTLAYLIVYIRSCTDVLRDPTWLDISSVYLLVYIDLFRIP